MLLHYWVKIVISFFPVSINRSLAIRCNRITLTFYLLSKHRGYLATPVCFQDFCFMKTIQLLLYLVYFEHVSRRTLLPSHSMKHTFFFQRMHWSIAGIPDGVMKDQHTNQECRYNSGNQKLKVMLCCYPWHKWGHIWGLAMWPKYWNKTLPF